MFVVLFSGRHGTDEIVFTQLDADEIAVTGSSVPLRGRGYAAIWYSPGLTPVQRLKARAKLL